MDDLNLLWWLTDDEDVLIDIEVGLDKFLNDEQVDRFSFDGIFECSLVTRLK